MILDIKKVGNSRTLKAIILALVAFAILCLAFQAGVFVGFHKASFLFKSGDNFYRTFGDRDDMMMSFRDENTGGHGAVGKIVKVSLPTVVVLGADNIEKVILTNASTSIRQFRSATSTNSLSVDQYITVLGSPNDQGQIVAKFIRIIPAPANK